MRASLFEASVYTDVVFEISLYVCSIGRLGCIQTHPGPIDRKRPCGHRPIERKRPSKMARIASAACCLACIPGGDCHDKDSKF